MEKNEFPALFEKAKAAGMAAGAAVVPPVMIVKEADVLSGAAIPGGQQWVVPSGPCGFAWVNIVPGNSPFANWIKKNKLGRKNSFAGGVDVNVWEFGQSMVKKEEFAFAFAKVLQEAGIKAFAESRMD